MMDFKVKENKAVTTNQLLRTPNAQSSFSPSKTLFEKVLTPSPRAKKNYIIDGIGDLVTHQPVDFFSKFSSSTAREVGQDRQRSNFKMISNTETNEVSDPSKEDNYPEVKVIDYEDNQQEPEKVQEDLEVSIIKRRTYKFSNKVNATGKTIYEVILSELGPIESSEGTNMEPACKTTNSKFHKSSLEELQFDLDSLRDIPEEDKDLPRMEGCLFKLTRTNGKIKGRFFKLIGKDFFYYKKKTDSQYECLHHLSNTFVKECKKQTLDGNEFFSFSICYNHKDRVYFCDNQKEYEQWVKTLKTVTGYEDVSSRYKQIKLLGNGSFGKVFACLDKETKRKVAIKIVDKTKLPSEKLEYLREELEILKICQHPNIIKVFDVYENNSYFYIVMEMCEGGDLYDYLEARKFTLSERRAAELVQQIACAIYYLHSFGIVHRDLKPENITMTDSTDEANIKILDFGLSKIIGPNEKLGKAVGTLTYAAPEVLLQKPHDFAVDVWSLGVIAYFLLSGFLPFNSDKDEEIVKKTVKSCVPFPSKQWIDKSNYSKCFILDLLVKDQSKRIKIKEVVTHEWFTKVLDMQEIVDRYSNPTKRFNSFELYSQLYNLSKQKKK